MFLCLHADEVKMFPRAVGAGTLGPASNHENYETNPKQFLRILFKCNGFAQFCWFFCLQNQPKTPGSPGPDARISSSAEALRFLFSTFEADFVMR